MSPNPVPGSPLTPREVQVLVCLRDGMTLRQAAEHLGMTYETVRSTLQRARFRLGTAGKTQTVVQAIVAGFLPLTGQVPAPRRVSPSDPWVSLLHQQVVVVLRPRGQSGAGQLLGTLVDLSPDTVTLAAGPRRREIARTLVAGVVAAKMSRRLSRSVPYRNGLV